MDSVAANATNLQIVKSDTLESSASAVQRSSKTQATYALHAGRAQNRSTPKLHSHEGIFSALPDNRLKA
jgi:hypothetical protein